MTSRTKNGPPFTVGDAVRVDDGSGAIGRVVGMRRSDYNYHWVATVRFRRAGQMVRLTYDTSNLRKTMGTCSECQFEVENGHAPGCSEEIATKRDKG